MMLMPGQRYISKAFGWLTFDATPRRSSAKHGGVAPDREETAGPTSEPDNSPVSPSPSPEPSLETEDSFSSRLLLPVVSRALLHQEMIRFPRKVFPLPNHNRQKHLSLRTITAPDMILLLPFLGGYCSFSWPSVLHHGAGFGLLLKEKQKRRQMIPPGSISGPGKYPRFFFPVDTAAIQVKPPYLLRAGWIARPG